MPEYKLKYAGEDIDNRLTQVTELANTMLLKDAGTATDLTLTFTVSDLANMTSYAATVGYVNTTVSTLDSSLAKVAKSGSYNDLTDLPEIASLTVSIEDTTLVLEIE